MKILGTLFRLLCALVVLLAAAVYLDSPLQVSLVDYLGAFTPEHVQSLVTNESWLLIAGGALLLLTLCCGLKLGWNLVYSLATLAFFAEVAILTLGPELALPTAARGLGWEPMLRELALHYPVPALMIPVLCILGCLCSSAPVRIAWTSLLSCVLCYGCAELLSYGVQHWQAMETPFLPRALQLIAEFPWSLAALPAVFFVQYSLFMAMFETFIPRKKKAGADKKDEPKKEEETKSDKPAEAKLPAAAATVAVAANPVTVKRPVVLKKSPLTPAPTEAKKPEEKKAENEKPEDKKEEAPAAAKPTPEAEKPAEPEAPKAADTPGTKEPVKEEAPAPAPIPSVPLPPKNEEAS